MPHTSSSHLRKYLQVPHTCDSFPDCLHFLYTLSPSRGNLPSSSKSKRPSSFITFLRTRLYVMLPPNFRSSIVNDSVNCFVCFGFLWLIVDGMFISVTIERFGLPICLEFRGKIAIFALSNFLVRSSSTRLDFKRVTADF